MTPLLRITSPAEWAGGRIDDDGDGFVHLSEPRQVLVPANAMYRGQGALQLLVIDRAALDGEIRIEGGFPHLYGTLTSDAVVEVVPMPCDDDGAFRLALVPWDAAASPASDLIAAMIDELSVVYGPDAFSSAGAPSAKPAEMGPPAGAFLVGWDDAGHAVCGGGVKRFDDGLAEIKRMFVVPGARGRGHARRLLAGLEDAARRLGYAGVRLDTGPEQPHARSLYEAAGYRPIADYNGNPAATYWGEKLL